MTYIYDVILNFNNELYDFYEWRKDDLLYHIKRINLVRVNSRVYNDFIDYNVCLSDEFLLSIFNRCEYFNNRSIDKIPYAFLISDGYRVMGLTLDMHGNITKYSSLLLDEEEDILDVVERLGEVSIQYKRDKHRVITSMRTRNENNILRYIKKDLNTCYKEKNLTKLKYLYYEFFNKESNDIDLIYQSLINELTGELSIKHYNLYNLVKLSLCHKSV